MSYRREACRCCSDAKEPATKADNDNRSNQLNPNNPAYDGGTTHYKGSGDKADLDNHANQLNPNNPSSGGGGAGAGGGGGKGRGGPK